MFAIGGKIVYNGFMRLKFIICKVLQKEAYLCASRSKNIVDVVLMHQGLHETPDILRTEVQKALEETTDVQDRPYDAALLGYGLCSNGILGLSAKIPIVVPRGHDCITLLLGSKEKYQQYFDTHRGVYWYSVGWIESGTQPSQQRYEEKLAEYRERFGEDNARYLMETEQTWIKEYSRATYIDWDLPGSDDCRKFTKNAAEFLNWKYDEVKGDSSLLQKMVDGRWDDREFLIVPPGRKIVEDLTNPGIIDSK